MKGREFIWYLSHQCINPIWVVESDLYFSQTKLHSLFIRMKDGNASFREDCMEIFSYKHISETQEQCWTPGDLSRSDWAGVSQVWRHEVLEVKKPDISWRIRWIQVLTMVMGHWYSALSDQIWNLVTSVPWLMSPTVDIWNLIYLVAGGNVRRRIFVITLSHSDWDEREPRWGVCWHSSGSQSEVLHQGKRGELAVWDTQGGDDAEC